MLQPEKGPVGSVQANHTLLCPCLAIISLRFARAQGEEQEKCQQSWCRRADGEDEVGLHMGTWKEHSGKACSLTGISHNTTPQRRVRATPSAAALTKGGTS